MSDNARAEEVEWTDDQIRWAGDESVAERSKTNDEDEAPVLDPFKDPDPHKVFSFLFPYPGRTTPGLTENDNSIEIELRGFKNESDQIWKSTGLTLWRASEHLCDYLVNHTELLKNKRILELGAGLGLCGILAHHLSSFRDSGSCSDSNDEDSLVMLTDGDTDVLAHLRDNVKKNANTELGHISCHQLLWGSETSKSFLENHCNRKTFDVLLAADIVYSPVIIQPLWETVKTLLSRDTGIFLLAYTQRVLHVSFEEDVLSAAQEAGFSYVGPKQWESPIDKTEGIYIFRWNTDVEKTTSSYSVD